MAVAILVFQILSFLVLCSIYARLGEIMNHEDSDVRSEWVG